MNLRSLVRLAGAATFTAAFGWGTPLHADPPKVVQTPIPAQALPPLTNVSLPPRRLAPAALDVAKRNLRFAAAFKSLGAGVPELNQQVIFLMVRVTPAAPKHPTGAEILGFGPGHFSAAAPGDGHGSYALQRAPSKGSSSMGWAWTTVRMKFPVEGGKLYGIDCTMSAPQGPLPRYVLAVANGSGGGDAKIEDGHITSGFKPAGNAKEVEVTLHAFPNVSAGQEDVDLGTFHGCEIGK